MAQKEPKAGGPVGCTNALEDIGAFVSIPTMPRPVPRRFSKWNSKTVPPKNAMAAVELGGASPGPPPSPRMDGAPSMNNSNRLARQKTDHTHAIPSHRCMAPTIANDVTSAHQGKSKEGGGATIVNTR